MEKRTEKYGVFGEVMEREIGAAIEERLGPIRSGLEEAIRSLSLVVSGLGAPGSVLSEPAAPSEPKRVVRMRWSARSMRLHRKSLGLSRKEYGRLLGVGLKSIYFWESGQRRPSPEILVKWREISQGRHVRDRNVVAIPSKGKGVRTGKSVEDVTPSENGASPATKQRTWQKRMIAEGKCATCGAPRNHYAAQCDDCNEKRRLATRMKRTGSPKRLDKRGRHPLIPDNEASNHTLYMRAYMRRKRVEAEAAGLCVKCYKVPPGGAGGTRRMCASCASRQRVQQRERYARKAGAVNVTQPVDATNG
jgi:DNA-binding XRE family transcriptional regulator